MKAAAILMLMFFGFSVFADGDESTSRLSDQIKERKITLKLSTIGYHYEEPGLMKIHGQMYGVEGGWRNTFHLWGMAVPFGANADIFAGRNTYDGGVVHTSGIVTPESAPSHDFISDFEGFVGPTLLDSEHHELEILIGPGLWELYNRVDGSGSYTREITYFYIPVKLNYILRLFTRYKINLAAQYDTFLYGYVHSALSELGSPYDDVNNNQTSGSGYRFTAGFEYLFNSWSLLVDGYYKAWDIANSDSQYSAGGYWREPHNTTKMIGINAGVRF